MEEMNKHSVVLNARQRLSADGVEDVESFEEDKIVAFTTEGQMTIKGANLKINKLSVDDKKMEIEGIIDTIEYQDTHHGEGGGFWGKIFK